MSPISTADYIRILPELVLTVFGIAVMLIDPLLKPLLNQSIRCCELPCVNVSGWTRPRVMCWR